MNIEYVTFDLDDTLWATGPLLQRASACFHTHLKEILEPLTIEFPPSEFNALMFQNYTKATYNWTLAREETLRYCIHKVGHEILNLTTEDDIEKCIRQAMDAFLIPRSKPDIFSGVQHLFQTLKIDHGLRLGALTNGNCSIRYLPSYFHEYLEFILHSETVGAAKPSKDMFNAAINAFHAVGEKVKEDSVYVHVGDSYEADIVGAKGVGWKTIWIRPSQVIDCYSRKQILTNSPADYHEYPAADAIIRHVTAVLDVVKYWADVNKLERKSRDSGNQ